MLREDRLLVGTNKTNPEEGFHFREKEGRKHRVLRVVEGKKKVPQQKVRSKEHVRQSRRCLQWT